MNRPFYYIGKSVLLKDTPLVKLTRNYIRDSSGVFSVSLLMKISLISLISSLSLTLYFNSLVYDRNIFGSSWKVFGNLRKSSKNCRKMFIWPSEQFWKIFGNLRKVVGNLQKIVQNAVISMSRGKNNI